MITPYVTAAQFAAEYATMKPGEHRIIEKVPYTHQGVPYCSNVKIFLSFDSRELIHCGCGCAMRLLTHYDERPGLCCSDCLLRERHKESKSPVKVKKLVSKAKPTRQRKKAA